MILFCTKNKTPASNTVPKMSKINPDTLLITLIFFTVSFDLNLPASVTLATSAVILIRRVVVKIIIRSLIVCVTAIAVAAVSQKANTAGLSVFNKNPWSAICAWSLALRGGNEISSGCKGTFLKKDNKHPFLLKKYFPQYRSVF